ncbi:MAG: hypothetical protein A2V88_07270 [Elusimicrobia bacterium RBG_16_66_12]|nr:MAG: hypothetical protein A2V88_07270 [Elusimicrobia bacterium RBG_16_66_12]
MSAEPAAKRVVAFVDGQNLFYAAKKAFGSQHPDYDVRKLSEWVCRSRGWSLSSVRFYTGVPDQDFSEVADEVRLIAAEQGRWIKIASAFPSSPASRDSRGINKTDWIKIDRGTYEACSDPRDYGLSARPETRK